MSARMLDSFARWTDEEQGALADGYIRPTCLDFGNLANLGPVPVLPARPGGRSPAGASLADLKKRLGHASSAAALRYMHAVDGRDEQVAVALSDLASRGDAALPVGIARGSHDRLQNPL